MSDDPKVLPGQGFLVRHRLEPGSEMFAVSVLVCTVNGEPYAQDGPTAYNVARLDPEILLPERP